MRFSFSASNNNTLGFAAISQYVLRTRRRRILADSSDVIALLLSQRWVRPSIIRTRRLALEKRWRVPSRIIYWRERLPSVSLSLFLGMRKPCIFLRLVIWLTHVRAYTCTGHRRQWRECTRTLLHTGGLRVAIQRYLAALRRACNRSPKVSRALRSRPYLGDLRERGMTDDKVVNIE